MSTNYVNKEEFILNNISNEKKNDLIKKKKSSATKMKKSSNQTKRKFLSATEQRINISSNIKTVRRHRYKFKDMYFIYLSHF